LNFKPYFAYHHKNTCESDYLLKLLGQHDNNKTLYCPAHQAKESTATALSANSFIKDQKGKTFSL
jgi:hypothetical protein